MKIKEQFKIVASVMLLISTFVVPVNNVFARAPIAVSPSLRMSHSGSHHKVIVKKTKHHNSSAKKQLPSSHKIAKSSSSGHSRHSKYSHLISQAKHSRHHRHHHVKEVANRHAYPVDLFMMNAPGFDLTPLTMDVKDQVQTDFTHGIANTYPAQMLVKAGIVQFYPMHGGIYNRREPVKYIILHSTETGRPMNATRVIDSWSSGGRRHAGAQFVVDRDGVIYQATDPDLATVHVNIFKTLPGINNDNSVGIEMVHAGSQIYTMEQRQAMIKLVAYLQDRYKVLDEDIITHRYAQQGDHTDPVSFDTDSFLAEKNRFRMQATAYRDMLSNDEIAAKQPSIYLLIHNNKATSNNMPSNDQVVNKSVPSEMLTKKNSRVNLRGPIEMDAQAAAISPAQPVLSSPDRE